MPPPAGAADKEWFCKGEKKAGVIIESDDETGVEKVKSKSSRGPGEQKKQPGPVPVMVDSTTRPLDNDGDKDPKASQDRGREGSEDENNKDEEERPDGGPEKEEQQQLGVPDHANRSIDAHSGSTVARLDTIEGTADGEDVETEETIPDLENEETGDNSKCACEATTNVAVETPEGESDGNVDGDDDSDVRSGVKSNCTPNPDVGDESGDPDDDANYSDGDLSAEFKASVQGTRFEGAEVTPHPLVACVSDEITDLRLRSAVSGVTCIRECFPRSVYSKATKQRYVMFNPVRPVARLNMLGCEAIFVKTLGAIISPGIGW